MTQLTPSAHSRFSPSGSSRWLFCTASVPFCESLNLPHRESEYANEGTACHELAAHCLQNGILDASEFEGVVFYKGIPTDREMINATNDYVSYILGYMHEGATLEVEKRITMEPLHPGMGGTSDAVIWSKTEFHTFDLKYGRGVPVEVEENTQLGLYQSGRLQELVKAGKIDLSTITTMAFHIIQPRAPHPDGPCRRWDSPLEWLRNLWSDAKAAIKEANSPSPKFHPGAKQCKWCEGAPACKALAAHNMTIAMSDFENLASPQIGLIQANRLTPSQISDILKHSDTIENWIKAVITYAQFQLEHKQEIPNYKLVRGRANRGWANGSETQVVKFVEDKGFKKEDCYSEPKFKSPSQIESLVGKKTVAEIASLIVKPQGRITIAHISDKRESVTVDDTAKADFASFSNESNEE